MVKLAHWKAQGWLQAEVIERPGHVAVEVNLDRTGEDQSAMNFRIALKADTTSTLRTEHNNLPHHQWNAPVLCATANLGTRLPQWVTSGRWRVSASCPLFCRKRTLVQRSAMSALCHKRTDAPQQNAVSFDHFVGGHLHEQRYRKAKCPCGFEIDSKVKFRRLQYG
jgi:hypothetical protein